MRPMPKVVWLALASECREFIEALNSAGVDGGLVEQFSHKAMLYDRIAADSIKGRPEKEPPLNALLALRDPDLVVYRDIEAIRQNGSVLGAIKTYLRNTWNRKSGVRQQLYVERNLGQLRNRYNRGKSKIVQKIRI